MPRWPLRVGEWWHGLPGGYSNFKCRCVLCRAAWAKYHREKRKNDRLKTQKEQS